MPPAKKTPAKKSEKKPKGEGSSLAPPFLLKLYDMVTQAATDEVVVHEDVWVAYSWRRGAGR